MYRAFMWPFVVDRLAVPKKISADVEKTDTE
jgi:hypothetical protein